MKVYIFLLPFALTLLYCRQKELGFNPRESSHDGESEVKDNGDQRAKKSDQQGNSNQDKRVVDKQDVLQTAGASNYVYQQFVLCPTGGGPNGAIPTPPKLPDLKCSSVGAVSGKTCEAGSSECDDSVAPTVAYPYRVLRCVASAIIGPQKFPPCEPDERAAS